MLSSKYVVAILELNWLAIWLRKKPDKFFSRYNCTENPFYRYCSKLWFFLCRCAAKWFLLFNFICLTLLFANEVGQKQLKATLQLHPNITSTFQDTSKFLVQKYENSSWGQKSMSNVPRNLIVSRWWRVGLWICMSYGWLCVN